MTAAEFLKKTMPKDDLPDVAKMLYVRPRAYCADGFSVSIQASNAAYCTPRRWDADKWEDVELGFPSTKDEPMMPYCENDGNPLGTIYPFMPMFIVEEVVKKHGGITGYVTTNDSKITKFAE